MTDAMKPRQWPDNIVSGEIRYGRHNYGGFYLADAFHGIPTFGSVTAENPPTIRGQHVQVFNYPGQTEAIAAQLVHRWNCHEGMLAALTACQSVLHRLVRGEEAGAPSGLDIMSAFAQCCDAEAKARAAISRSTTVS